jgi:hypothetical protein
MYRLSGAHWQQLNPPTVPLNMSDVAWNPGAGHGLALSFYDPVAGYGPRGFTLAGANVSQVYLTSWPSIRFGHLMAFDAARGVYVLHGGGNGFGGAAYADTWEYSPGPSAAYATFGAGCLGSRGVPTLAPQGNSLPRVNTTFTVQANNLPLTGPAFLFFGLSNTSYGVTPLPFHLAPIGAPGCNLLVSGDLIFGFPNILGVGTWSFTVPNQPGIQFFQQAFAFDPAANSLALTVTNGGQGTVGN